LYLFYVYLFILFLFISLRPAEMSSKIPVPIVRVVFPSKNTLPARDPRFDELSGRFEESRFEKHYSFLEELKERDLNQLKEQLKAEKDLQQKEKLKRALQIAQDRRKTELDKKKTKEAITHLKKEIKPAHHIPHSQRKPFFPHRGNILFSFSSFVKN
jgi:ribosomal RNA-processing protein 36